ncbi:MAG: V-type ATPase subunit [Candidatus Nanosalina sp.]
MKLASFIQKDYPYMNARVSAKGAKLLDRSDYENLLKMEPNEIARKLEEGEYKEEINELGSYLDGVELVETALRMNAARTLSDLVEMSPESLKGVLKIYMRRYELQNLKRLLRAKEAGRELELKTDIVPGSAYTVKELEELAEKDYEDIIEEISFDGLVDYQDHLQDAEELTEVEKALDQAYLDELNTLAGKTGSLKLSRFVREEIEYENLRIILRLKRYGVDESEIREKIFRNGGGITEEVLNSNSFEDALEVLQESDWDIDTESDLEEIEHQLDVKRLRKARSTLRSSPLGIAPIMAYIVAKMIEVKNLRTMIQAKATGIQSNEEIRKNLVIIDGR